MTLNNNGVVFKTGHELANRLSGIPEIDRIDFLKDLGADQIRAIVNDGKEVLPIIAQLPQQHWQSFIDLLGVKAVKALADEMRNVSFSRPETKMRTTPYAILGMKEICAYINSDRNLKGNQFVFHNRLMHKEIGATIDSGDGQAQAQEKTRCGSFFRESGNPSVSGQEQNPDGFSVEDPGCAPQL